MMQIVTIIFSHALCHCGDELTSTFGVTVGESIGGKIMGITGKLAAELIRVIAKGQLVESEYLIKIY
jgi:hypothetical protein